MVHGMHFLPLAYSRVVMQKGAGTRNDKRTNLDETKLRKKAGAERELGVK